MRSRPADVDPNRVRALLSASWHLDTQTLTYAPVGGGSYHWIAIGSDGTRHFVTVDDLDRKPWLGAEREVAYGGLRRSYETALTLKNKANLGFVIAPTPDSSGSIMVRLDSRYTLAVFPFVDGEPIGQFAIPHEDRPSLVHMLAELHAATSDVEGIALRRGFDLPGRQELDDVLGDLDVPWKSGPFAERARRWLSRNADHIFRSLDTYTRLANQVAASARPVITHGEPHGGNVLRADGTLMLIDWDTVALAPAERDLWDLDGDATNVLDLYRHATGREVDRDSLRFYALAWQLSDLAAFISTLRSPHRRSKDAEHAWSVLLQMNFALFA